LPVIGEPAVPNVKNSQNAGELSGHEERPGPPDLSRKIYDGFVATINFTPTRKDAHLAQQLVARQREKVCNARVLQGREAEATLLECVAESARQRSANSAITVEEDPASRGVSAFHVSYF
jgi:hypothetical protein